MTTFSLKIIAIIAMTVDHFAKILGQSGLLSIFPGMSLSTSYLIINLMEGIGRIAFPLFAFMIAEGASKTHSLPKYIGRLMLFAVISEPIFYYAFSIQTASVEGFFTGLLRLHLTNVFFTLALGVVAIYIYQMLEKKPSKKKLLIFIPALLFLILFAGYAKCDYGIAGVILIIAFYLAKKKIYKIAVIVVWALGLYIFGQAFNGFGFNWSQVTSYAVIDCICAIIPGIWIWFYNGKRGKPLKWSFYIYYPAHLLIFACLSNVLQ